MWKMIGDLLAKAREALGIELPEIPDLTAAGDAVTAAVDTASGQAEEVSITVTGAATELASGLNDTAATVGDAATGAADQAADAAATLSDKARG